ncbi:MAG: HAD family hydrolase [Clostridium perfringens]|nr:HAD family hydrolase [Clostridium perfringens]
MKRAIFFDIDGTLLDCVNGLTDISPRVKEAIRSLQKNGDYVFIASGRPYAFLSQAILDFGFDGFVLCNGAYVKLNNKTIYSESINKKFIAETIEKFEQNNIQYILEGQPYSYMNKNNKALIDFYEIIGISSTLILNDCDVTSTDIYKIEAFCFDENHRNICIDLVNNNADYGYFNSIDEKFFEIYLKKNHKATGIMKALEYLDIPLENSYAFGDGDNDVEMLETVGCGIAMGNASDRVKSYAKEVTDTVTNDGVAVGIEKYIGIPVLR